MFQMIRGSLRWLNVIVVLGMLALPSAPTQAEPGQAADFSPVSRSEAATSQRAGEAAQPAALVPADHPLGASAQASEFGEPDGTDVLYLPLVSRETSAQEGELEASTSSFTDGQDLLVTGTVMLDPGAYVFGAITVTNSAALILQGDPAAGTGVTITAESMTVAVGGRITADGQGYAGGSFNVAYNSDRTGKGGGSGGGTGAQWGAGGGYGGWGGKTGEAVAGGSPYGSLYQPLALGSGGGGGGGGGCGTDQRGGAGGGAIKLVVAGTLRNEGEITADGLDGPWVWCGSSGAGSGGSVWIAAGRLTGGGKLTANGGSSPNAQTKAGGGSGGRVAVYAGQNDYTGQYESRGGGGWRAYAGAGTVYLKGSSGQGELLVDNGGHDGASAGLAAGEYQFDRIYLSGYGHVRLLDSGSVVSPSLLTVTDGALTGDSTGARLEVDGRVVASPGLTISGPTLAVAGELSGLEAITTTGSGGLRLIATPWHAGVYTLTSVTVLSGSQVSLLPYQTGTTSYEQDYGVELRAAELTVAAGGRVTADGQGYRGGSLDVGFNPDRTGKGGGPGGGTGAHWGGGGGYGGWGGKTGEAVAGGSPYGLLYAPAVLGSGGGGGGGGGCNSAQQGGAGGGALKLVVAGTLRNEGEITADGLDGPSDPCASSGAGSGGSIWIAAGRLTGGGKLTANGGNSPHPQTKAGGGSGGRIAVYAGQNDYSGQYESRGGNGWQQYAGAGTVYLKGSSGYGELRVDNNGHDGASAGLVAGDYQFDRIYLSGYGHARLQDKTEVGSHSALTVTEGALTGDGTDARLEVDGRVVAPQGLTIGGPTLAVAGELSGLEAITTTGSGGLRLIATPWHTGVYTLTSVTVLSGSQVSLLPYRTGTTAYEQDYGVELRAAELTVAAGGKVTADGQGYAGGSFNVAYNPDTSGKGGGPGGGTGTHWGAGAGYGGWGGKTGAGMAGASPYGSLYRPAALGSGGGGGGGGGCGNDQRGGAGGGALKLVVAGTLSNEGEITADGQDGPWVWCGSSGAGSGGSIWIEAGRFTGSGRVTANGGSSPNAQTVAGGGSGGRIAVYAGQNDYSGTVEVEGGAGYAKAGHGTVYDDVVDPYASTVVIRPQANVGPGDTTVITVSLATTATVPVSGYPVSVGLVSGSQAQIGGQSVATGAWTTIGTTNAAGIVTATLSSTLANQKTIEARGKWTYLAHTAAVTITNSAFDPARSTLVAQPSSVPAGGTTQAQLTLTLYDRYGNPVPGKPVTLSASAPGITLTQPATTTNSSGQATGWIRSTISQTVTVSAVADTIPLTVTAKVTFGQPDVAVQLDAGTALLGRELTYTLHIENQGSSLAPGVVLTDTLPSPVTFARATLGGAADASGRVVVWDLGDLASKASRDVTLVASIPATATAGSELVDHAAVSLAGGELNLANNHATITNTLYMPEPELQVTPSHPSIALQRGTTSTVTLQVTNASGYPATGLAVASAGYVPWLAGLPSGLPDLATGQSATITATLEPPAGLSIGTYEDVVTITSGGTERAVPITVRVVDVTRTLSMALQDSAGQPLTLDANVVLVQSDVSVRAGAGISATIHRQLVAEATGGSATFADLDTGIYDYRITADGYGAATGQITVVAGDGVQESSVRLTGAAVLVPDTLYPEIYVHPGATGSAQVVVRNAGQAASDAVQATIPSAAEWMYSGLAGATDGLPAGQALTITLVAVPPVTQTLGIYRQYVNVLAGETTAARLALTVHVTDGTTGAVQVHLTDAAGEPLVGARVSLVSAQSELVVTEGVTQTYHPSFTGVTDAAGNLSFRDVAAGEYTYYASAKGREPLAGDASVSPGGTLVLEDVLETPTMTASWEVDETSITDTYVATLTVQFVPGPLHVVPVVLTSCGSGEAHDYIHVGNTSDAVVTATISIKDTGLKDPRIFPPSAAIPPQSEFIFEIWGVPVANKTGVLTVSGVDATGEAVSVTTPIYTRLPVVPTTCGDSAGFTCKLGSSLFASSGGGGTISFPDFTCKRKITLPGSLDIPGSGPATRWDENTRVGLRFTQYAMLERQAFVGTLSLAALSAVSDLHVQILAEGANGVDVSGGFSITPTVPTSLPDLAPGQSVDQSWTIVPSNLGLQSTTSYVLRARISYRDRWGQPHTLDSLPAQITVSPQPEVHLTYFVPRYVRAGKPFLLGVLASNRGFGTAQSLRIESGKPVVRDPYGRLQGFSIGGTYVNGATNLGTSSLTLGDLPPGATIVGGWLMETARDGDFAVFQARCSHLDYQGMKLSDLVYCDGASTNGPAAFIDTSFKDRTCDDCPAGGLLEGTQGHAGGPINTRTGNYHYPQTDLSLATGGGPLQMVRSYNSAYAGETQTNGLAPGWMHGYALRLSLPESDDRVLFGSNTGNAIIDRSTMYFRPTVVLYLAGGSRIRFAANNDGTYTTYPGALATLSREAVGQVVTYTVTASDQTRYLFDASGRLLELRDPHGVRTLLTYDGDRLSRVSDPSGARWLAFSYDEQARISEVSDPISRTVRYTYDTAGDLTQVTDPDGRVWRYVYTGDHLLHEVYDPTGALVERTDYTETASGSGTTEDDTATKATSQTSATGMVTTLSYGRTGTTVVEDGRTRSDGYDLFGVMPAQVDALGNSVSYVHDDNFRVESTTDALGHTTQLGWSEDGFNVDSTTDALGNVTHMAYDSANNLLHKVDPAGHAVTYTYDLHNNLLTETDALGGVTSHTYDDWGHVLTTVDPAGRATGYAYDTLGQLVAMTDTAGLVTRYAYDGAGRLVTTTLPAGTVEVRAYDNTDHLVAVTKNYTPIGDQNYIYGVLSRLDEYNLRTAYAYDAAGRQVLVTDTLGYVTRSQYDVAGRLVRTTENYLPGQAQNYQDQYNRVTAYGYDLAGNRVTTTDTLGSVTRTEYDALSRPVTVTVNYQPGHVADAETNLVQVTAYDANGNAVRKTDALGRVTVTEYDALNRPVAVIAN